jgi:hypothetical protein
VSIVNISIGKDRALVGCDTACQYGDDPNDRGHMSKMVILQGMNGVLAYRGERSMFERIFMRVFFGREPESFDALVARMPSIIDTVSSGDLPAIDLTLELYAVAWSPSRARMAGAVYVIDAQGALVDAQVDTWQCATSPEVPDDPDPAIDSPADMRAYAEKQVAYGASEHGGLPIGGSLFLAEVMPGTVIVASAGMLGQI